MNPLEEGGRAGRERDGREREREREEGEEALEVDARKGEEGHG